eukprot:TRINITY_DN90762_c0_g1_i1.p1 TRINITY_DN90762_c0_g1~~TRINITY_DN90762_c0_g1_i1.p1  ORF type:complete len:1434 (-),score=473.24 TRINITY_DN90762_c0_g1_i1:88-4389(-)
MKGVLSYVRALVVSAICLSWKVTDGARVDDEDAATAALPPAAEGGAAATGGSLSDSAMYTADGWEPEMQPAAGATSPETQAMAATADAASSGVQTSEVLPGPMQASFQAAHSMLPAEASGQMAFYSQMPPSAATGQMAQQEAAEAAQAAQGGALRPGVKGAAGSLSEEEAIKAAGDREIRLHEEMQAIASQKDEEAKAWLRSEVQKVTDEHVEELRDVKKAHQRAMQRLHWAMQRDADHARHAEKLEAQRVEEVAETSLNKTRAQTAEDVQEAQHDLDRSDVQKQRAYAKLDHVRDQIHTGLETAARYDDAEMKHVRANSEQVAKQASLQEAYTDEMLKRTRKLAREQVQEAEAATKHEGSLAKAAESQERATQRLATAAFAKENLSEEAKVRAAKERTFQAEQGMRHAKLDLKTTKSTGKKEVQKARSRDAAEIRRRSEAIREASEDALHAKRKGEMTTQVVSKEVKDTKSISADFVERTKKAAEKNERAAEMAERRTDRTKELTKRALEIQEGLDKSLLQREGAVAQQEQGKAYKVAQAVSEEVEAVRRRELQDVSEAKMQEADLLTRARHDAKAQAERATHEERIAEARLREARDMETADLLRIRRDDLRDRRLYHDDIARMQLVAREHIEEENNKLNRVRWQAGKKLSNQKVLHIDEMQTAKLKETHAEQEMRMISEQTGRERAAADHAATRQRVEDMNQLGKLQATVRREEGKAREVLLSHHDELLQTATEAQQEMANLRTENQHDEQQARLMLDKRKKEVSDSLFAIKKAAQEGDYDTKAAKDAGKKDARAYESLAEEKQAASLARGHSFAKQSLQRMQQRASKTVNKLQYDKEDLQEKMKGDAKEVDQARKKERSMAKQEVAQIRHEEQREVQYANHRTDVGIEDLKRTSEEQAMRLARETTTDVGRLRMDSAAALNSQRNRQQQEEMHLKEVGNAKISRLAEEESSDSADAVDRTAREEHKTLKIHTQDVDNVLHQMGDDKMRFDHEASEEKKKAALVGAALKRDMRWVSEDYDAAQKNAAKTIVTSSKQITAAEKESALAEQEANRTAEKLFAEAEQKTANAKQRTERQRLMHQVMEKAYMRDVHKETEEVGKTEKDLRATDQLLKQQTFNARQADLDLTQSQRNAKSLETLAASGEAHARSVKHKAEESYTNVQAAAERHVHEMAEMEEDKVHAVDNRGQRRVREADVRKDLAVDRVRQQVARTHFVAEAEVHKEELLQKRVTEVERSRLQALASMRIHRIKEQGARMVKKAEDLRYEEDAKLRKEENDLREVYQRARQTKAEEGRRNFKHLAAAWRLADQHVAQKEAMSHHNEEMEKNVGMKNRRLRTSIQGERAFHNMLTANNRFKEAYKQATETIVREGGRNSKAIGRAHAKVAEAKAAYRDTGPLDPWQHFSTVAKADMNAELAHQRVKKRRVERDVQQ